MIKRKRQKNYKTLQVFTTGDVADLCFVEREKVYDWEKAGMLVPFNIPGSKHRRYARKDLIEFMRKYNIPLDRIENPPPLYPALGHISDLSKSAVHKIAITGAITNIGMEHLVEMPIQNPYQAAYVIVEALTTNDEGCKDSDIEKLLLDQVNAILNRMSFPKEPS